MQGPTPLQRAESMARKRFPRAKVTTSFGTVVNVETDELPLGTSVLVTNPRLPKP